MELLTCRLVSRPSFLDFLHVRAPTDLPSVRRLRSGGGIVYDSVEEDEYVETLNKLKANLNCIEMAERESFVSFFSLRRVLPFNPSLTSRCYPPPFTEFYLTVQGQASSSD